MVFSWQICGYVACIFFNWALMPVIGWLAGQTVVRFVSAWDHWIAFALLALIGGRMIREALNDEEKSDDRDPTRGFSLVMLSIATSIDALAVGFSLSLIGVSIWFPAFIIGLVAGVLTVAGMLVGSRVGDRWGPRVEILGGFVLIAIGVRILCEHLLT